MYKIVLDSVITIISIQITYLREYSNKVCKNEV